MISSSACPSSECSSSTETADPSCSTSKCCQSLAVFPAHLGSVCVGNESMCVFPLVRQMEGHRHHSAQQVGHHRGDNQQRRHYRFSHGECLVWSLHTHMGTLTHTRVGRETLGYLRDCNGANSKDQYFPCRAFIHRRTWKWPSTSHAFSPPGTSSTNRTRSLRSESAGQSTTDSRVDFAVAVCLASVCVCV